MANPSLKNGYISIANELVEKLATLSIPSSEMRVIWVVWRKTWGWKEGDRHKDWDWISLSQFSKLTTIKKTNIPKILKSLVYKRILVRKENLYKFNQNYDEWVVYKRITPVYKRIIGVIQTHTKKVIQTYANKRNKETNTKENTSVVPTHDDSISFNLEDYIKKLEEDSRRDLNIIGLYFEERKPQFLNVEQARKAVRRHLRSAGELIPFTDNQIIDSIPKAKKLTDGWTLETLLKVLTK